MSATERARSRARGVFYGWWIVIASAGIQMLHAGLMMQAYGAYVSVLINDFGWSKTALSFGYSLQPVQSGLQQAGHKVRTQALPYLADRAGDAVKAAGQRARARGGQDARPATVRRDLNGTAYVDVVSSRSVR